MGCEFVQVFVTAVLTLELANGRETILMPCNHLATEDGQTNNFQAEHGGSCCMCPPGSYLAEICRARFPNSTVCLPCERTDEKKTYRSYGPHQQQECELDVTTCTGGKVLIEGSTTLKSQCECPPGQVEVHGFLCVGEQSSTSPTTTSTTKKPTPPTAIGKIVDKPPETKPTVTAQESAAGNTRTLPTSTKSISSNAEEHDAETTADFDIIRSVKNPTVTSDVGVKLSEDADRTIKVYVAACLGVSLFVAIVVVVLVYCIRKRLSGVDKGIPVNSESGITLQTVNGSRTSSNSDGVDDGIESMQLLNRSSPTHEDLSAGCVSGNVDETASAMNEASPIVSCNQPAVPDHAIYPNPTGANQQPACTCPRPNNHVAPGAQPQNGLSQLHKVKRRAACSSMSTVIKKRDLATIADKLLPEGADFEDIEDLTRGDTPQRANKTFKRAIELNPSLTLWDLHELVRFNGTLHRIVAAKIEELSRSEPEAWQRNERAS